MARKKKEELVEVEKIGLHTIESKRIFNVSESFYYLLGIILSIILIFATKEFLSTINYLFVIIFAIVAVIKIINFIMEKDYERKNYSDMVTGIMSAWIAMFVFKYGAFLFLEMLPVLVSLLLITMSTSSLIKYFNTKRKGNQIMGITSLLLGIILICVPGNIMYILFKVTGVYLLITIILDIIDYKTSAYK